MDPDDWNAGGRFGPGAGGSAGAPARHPGWGNSAGENDFLDSADEAPDKAADADFEVEEEVADDEPEYVEEEDDDSEDSEDVEEDASEEEYDPRGSKGAAGAAVKRKRSESGDLDADLAMARKLQAAWGGEGGGSRRSSMRGVPATERGITYADHSDDDGGAGGGDFKYQEDEDWDSEPAGVRRSSRGSGGGGGGGMKIKIRMPPGGEAPSAQLMGQPAAGSAGVSHAEDSGAINVDEEGYIPWDDDAAEVREEEAKKRRRMPHCLLSPEEMAGMDDEVEVVLTHRDIEGMPSNPADPWASREFYVKWARYSYIHCSWDAYSTLSQLGGFKRVLNYCRKVDAAQAMRAGLSADELEEENVRAELEAELEREHSQLERVISERVRNPTEEEREEDGGGAVVQFLCKWNGLPYSENTWEAAADVEKTPGGAELVGEFRGREAAAAAPREGVDAARRAFSVTGQRAFEKQPEYLQGGGTLRDYQLEGLNWMAYSWARGVNGILADEMGLGKTVQCASMVGYLSQVQNLGGPFLIIVPLSTISNWAREFKKWIPQVNTVMYVGNAASRQVIRAFEFPNAAKTAGRQFKFDALITTYELALKDAALLRDVKWAYLMVDEAHRLKNNESALYRELAQWNFKSKLLVTGTPLQNNMRELWCLLHFLHPEKFPSSEEFEEAHDPRDPAGVQRLHAVLRPHLLRRVIKDVEKSLPPKNERILRVPMTPLQRQYYKWILTRNFKELNKSRGGSQVTLLNIIMDLKKCCNHPFLFESVRDEYKGAGGDTDDVAARLVLTSGKMVLLDKLLRRLKETGHRVLIFSQMVRVLDIIAEYMRAKAYRFQRLDGSTPAHERHQAMERFNAPDSPDFAFLLSTRAGGLGINLATADTVLLFDSDWNPQNDLQAMSRAHRIGQKDIVNIYRLVTSGSVEEDILERAKRKMVLDHLVIQRMDTSGRTVLDPAAAGGTAGARLFGKDEMAAILKFGAGDLFKEEEGGGGEGGEGGGGVAGGGGAMMSDEDLDALLARAEVVEHREEPPAGGAGELLASFNVATFKADEDDAAFWSRLIPENMRPAAAPAATEEPGIRAARLRTLEGGSATGGVLDPAAAAGLKPKVKRKAEPGPPVEGALLRIDRWPQAVDEEGKLVAGEDDPRPQGFPRTLTRREATAFVRAVKHRALASKLDLIAAEAGGAPSTCNKRALMALWHGLIRGCEKAAEVHQKNLRALQPPATAAGVGGDIAAASAAASGTATPAASEYAGVPPAVAPAAAPAAASAAGAAAKLASEPHLDFFGHDVRAGDMLALLRQMVLLENRAGAFATQPDAVKKLRLAMAERPAPTAWMRVCAWTADEDSALLVGVLRHGMGAWAKMAEDKDLRLGPKLALAAQKPGASPDLPKPSHLDTRVMGLLRQIEKVATRPPKPPLTRVRGGPRGTTAAGGTPGGLPAARAPSAAAIAAFNAVSEKCETALGQETLTLVRKLRTLQRRGSEMEANLVVSKTRKYMHSIGKRIEEAGAGEQDRAELWAYVSEFTENALSGDKMQGVYARLKKEDEGGGHGGETFEPPPQQQPQQQVLGGAVDAGVPLKKEEEGQHVGGVEELPLSVAEVVVAEAAPALAPQPPTGNFEHI